MAFNLAMLLGFLLVCGAILAVFLLVGKLIRPRVPHPIKPTTYECGERPFGPAWFNFNPRFYIIALVFLIFDVEVAFTYPVAVVFRRWIEQGNGYIAFIELAVFIGILLVGLAYVWAKGDLDWIRKLRRH